MNPAMLAALSGRMMPGNLGALAGSFLGMRNSSEMFAELLQSRTVRERIVDRYKLQRVYRKRYRQDSIKKLGKRTDVTEDRKTGIITVIVTDTDRNRARDMAQAYLDELMPSSQGSIPLLRAARRQFIEQRLVSVKARPRRSPAQLSNFSSKNATLDVKEQTNAMVDATAKLEGELIVARSELGSLDQIYGPDNVRVRAARARVSQLDQEMNRRGERKSLRNRMPRLPHLRAIPALAVQWADLYRRVRTQETMYELLTQEYEMARIEEAKSTAHRRDRSSKLAGKKVVSAATHDHGGRNSPLRSGMRSCWSSVGPNGRRSPNRTPGSSYSRGMILTFERDHPSWFMRRRTHNNGHQL